MSRQSRALKRRVSRRNKLLVGLMLFFVLAFILFGYFRSNQSQILEQEDYLNAVTSQILFIRDCAYYELDDFSSDNLSFPEGTKVSGYDQLTTSAMTVNAEYLDQQIRGIDALIKDKSYENWDGYAQQLQSVMSSSRLGKQDTIKFYQNSARYAPESLEELTQNRQKLESLETGTPIEITLNNLGLMHTGFVFSTISEYDKMACEAVLGSLTPTMLNDISRLSTETSNALRVINNDHCYALASVDKNTAVQGEEEVKKLKEQYKEGSNSEYYKMLVTRVDRVRQYPELSFTHEDKNFPVYLVDVITEENQKILVYMIKDYLQDLNVLNKLNVSLNVQDYQAWLIPQSAIIKKDNKTYVQLLEKGYFTHEIEVNVALYDQGKAVLKVADNPDISDGMTIKTYP